MPEQRRLSVGMYVKQRHAADGCCSAGRRSRMPHIRVQTAMHAQPMTTLQSAELQAARLPFAVRTTPAVVRGAAGSWCSNVAALAMCPQAVSQ